MAYTFMAILAVFTAVAMVVGIALEVRGNRRLRAMQQKIEADLRQAAGSGAGFEATHTVKTDSGTGMLLIDEVSRVIKAGCYQFESGRVSMRTIPVDGLVSVRVAENYKNKSYDIKRELRDAVLEGAWYGRLGILASVLGALFRSTYVRDVSLVLEAKDASDPEVALNFLSTPVDRDNPVFSGARKEAEKWRAVIEGLRRPGADRGLLPPVGADPATV
jgi:hypothetical protein